MKRLFEIAGVGAFSMLALASPSLAAKPKVAPPPDNTPVVTPDATPPPSGYAAPTSAVQVGVPGSSPAQSYSVPAGGGAPVSTSAPASTQPEPPVIARAELCLKTDAATAARAEQSTKLAVDLLLQDLCAPEVDAASLYVRNAEALARFNPMSERGRAGLSTARADPETGQIVAPANVDVSAAVEAAERSSTGAAPLLRKYAADLVLVEKVQLAAAGHKGR